MQCGKCGVFYENDKENFYYKNKNKPELGFLSWCKQCRINKQINYNKENREERTSYSRERRLNNPELNRKSVRSYQERNKEKVKQMSKKWRQDNSDKLKEYNIQHRNHDISEVEWNKCKQYFNYECAYCGISESDSIEVHKQKLHKEHVKHDGANDISNCVPSCKVCNSKKRRRELTEWYSETNRNIEFDINKLNKVIKWINEDYKTYIN